MRATIPQWRNDEARYVYISNIVFYISNIVFTSAKLCLHLQRYLSFTAVKILLFWFSVYQNYFHDHIKYNILNLVVILARK